MTSDEPIASPWYLRAFTMMGAWFTSLFLLGSLGLLVGAQGLGILGVLGFVLLLGASLLGRRTQDSDFLEHLVLSLSLAGRAGLTVGLYDELRDERLACALMALSEVFWFWLNPMQSGRLVSVFSVYFFGSWVAADIETRWWVIPPLVLPALVMPAMFVGKKVQLAESVRQSSGWASAITLAGASIVAAHFSSSSDALEAVLLANFVICMVGMVLGLVLARAPLTRAVSVLLFGSTLYVTRYSPGVAAGLLMGLVAFHSRRRALLILAWSTLALALMGYYYSLETTLLAKAGLLSCSGLVFGVAALMMAQKDWWRSLAWPGEKHSARRAWMATALLMTVAGVVNAQAALAEAERSEGIEVYLELRPQDPRDLLLGDYMAVRFQLAEDVRNQLKTRLDHGSGRAWTVLNADRVLSFVALDEGKPARADHRLVKYWVHGGRVDFDTTKIYFQEGHEPRFRSARYGKFRLQKDGRLTWLNFVAEDFQDL